ncbi:MAG: hypothetical protein QOD88_2839 [Mycobacterium sp.]|jgi:hypothetical protein|nr:hypothetical protein [Mycobacterium sp.]
MVAGRSVPLPAVTGRRAVATIRAKDARALRASQWRTDLADPSELERRLFPKPVDRWRPGDWVAFFATAQQLADQYGKEHVLAMVEELVRVDAGPTREMADAIRHSIRP